jgi:hypothetical protein
MVNVGGGDGQGVGPASHRRCRERDQSTPAGRRGLSGIDFADMLQRLPRTSKHGAAAPHRPNQHATADPPAQP